MRHRRLLLLASPLLLVGGLVSPSLAIASGGPPQGTQSNTYYANSGIRNGVTNVYATTKTSCYRPEISYAANAGPNDAYTGLTGCPGATTDEDTGAAAPYPTQVGSNSGFATGPSALVKNHSESDIRVDPTNPNHLIGSVKWFVSAEGYNHLLGFYESWDGGTTWPVQGHIPGYEGFSDDTDPVGAFDGYGNYYSLILPYQFAYYRGDARGGGDRRRSARRSNNRYRLDNQAEDRVWRELPARPGLRPGRRQPGAGAGQAVD